MGWDVAAAGVLGFLISGAVTLGVTNLLMRKPRRPGRELSAYARWFVESAAREAEDRRQMREQARLFGETLHRHAMSPTSTFDVGALRPYTEGRPVVDVIVKPYASELDQLRDEAFLHPEDDAPWAAYLDRLEESGEGPATLNRMRAIREGLRKRVSGISLDAFLTGYRRAEAEERRMIQNLFARDRPGDK